LERLTAGFARLVVRFRVVVVAFWVAATMALTVLLPNVEQAGTGGLGDLVATDADAIDAEIRSVELFNFPVLSRTVVVEREPDGFTRRELADIYRRSVELGRNEIPGLEGIAFALTVTDVALGGALGGDARAALTYLFYPPEIGPIGRTGLAERLVERTVPLGSREVGITGAVPARGEQLRSIRGALPLVELATLLLVSLAVGIHFRSVVAPAANVATIAVAYLAAVRLVGGAGEAVGLVVPEEVEPVMVALLFGVVTDYVIFFLSRFRGHVRDGTAAVKAAELTAVSLTPIVFTAGISVAGASAGLVVAELGFFQAFGPGLAVSILIALAVVLTLVPAILALLGEWVLWPGGGGRAGLDPSHRPGRLLPQGLGTRAQSLRERMIELPIRRPVVVAVLTAAPLLALALLLPRLELANTLISGLPRDSPPKQSFSLAAEDFPPGAISPTMVLVEAPGIAERARPLVRFERLLAERRNVSVVVGPGDVGDPPELGATVSPTGDAARYLVVFDVNPFGARAINTLGRLRADLGEMLTDAGLAGATASLAGDTALAEETVVATEADLARIVPVAALIVFAILALFLRALVAPLYLVATSLLALGASLGLTVLLFQEILGYGELTFYVPFAGTVLLVALGSDYNVYLVGRIWAEARRRPLREAIPVAGRRATAAITVAGLVLALSFAMLALVPLRPFRELAFLLAAGLLIDAFVVRTLLAPALITLIGERSGWPGKALRPLPGAAWKDDGPKA
jgi:putative drug exporter of the RND superfamily